VEPKKIFIHLIGVTALLLSSGQLFSIQHICAGISSLSLDAFRFLEIIKQLMI